MNQPAKDNLESTMDIDTEASSIQLSIIIKALNEEKYIAKCLESALEAIEGYNGEVILADSLSTDKTIEIAKNYPVKIVQLAQPEDKCCGVGAQLGYQHARGQFIYILDGDMELEKDFISSGIELLKSRGELGGVGGVVQEFGGGNYEFEARKRSSHTWASPGEKQWLTMGGLYRREAIESVGYLTNKYLHAYEEQELGLRLVSKGWKVERLDIPAVRHYGHTDDTASLMWRRWKSKYIDGAGELLRNSIGTPYFTSVLITNSRLIMMSGLFLAFFMSIFLLPFYQKPFYLFSLVIISLYLVLLIRKKDLGQAFISLILWPIRGAGFIRGLLRPQGSPESRVDSKIISE